MTSRDILSPVGIFPLTPSRINKLYEGTGPQQFARAKRPGQPAEAFQPDPKPVVVEVRSRRVPDPRHRHNPLDLDFIHQPDVVEYDPA